NLQHVQPSLWVLDTSLQELHICQVLMGVGVKEALGVITGVREDLIHLLVEVATLVGHLHRHTVAVHGVDDATGGNLGLEQADAVALHNQPLVHGFKQGHWGFGVGVSVAPCHGPFRVLQLLVDIWPNDALPHSLIHTELLVAHRVNDEARGSLGLQQGQGYSWHHDVLLHGLINAHSLVGWLEHNPPNAARAIEVLPDRVHVQHLFWGDGSLQHLLKQGPVNDTSFHQVISTHIASHGRELDGGPFLHFLL
ncbi:hypothetical protein N302_08428, partial [Corvus brachyrhynchos]